MATSPQSPPKRPRLSLQITAIANGPSVRTSRRVAAAVDMKSPTAFNTLSNVYATAVDRSTPIQENPPTALLSGRPILRLQTQTQDAAPATAKARHTPYLGPYLDTPLTAQPLSPAITINREVQFPSAMTATPPLSAQAQDANARVFTFDNTNKPGLPSQQAHPQSQESTTPAPSLLPSQSLKRRTNTLPANMTPKLPYTHPRSLRSILRNSPLPPLTTNLSPSSGQTISPRRTSLRLQEKAARRVAYNSPLEQTITTHKYTKSHIDLLITDDDTTPVSPSVTSDEGDVDNNSNVLDQTMAYSNLTRDGGQTPGPFEEMRRRMADMRASTPTTSSSSALSPTSTGGIRKKGGKRREKKRRWVWTIGQDEDGEESLPSTAGTPATAVPTLAMPAKKHPLAASTTVPVIAVPAPRPRSKTKLSTITNGRSLAVTVAVTPAPKQQEDQNEKREEREPTPIPSSSLPIPQSSPSGPWSSASSGYSSDADITIPQQQQPYLSIQTTHLGSGMVIEPPTPSVESIASSTQDSVFEHTIGYSSSVRGSFSSAGGGNGADVEMSDTSSFTSVEEQEESNYALCNQGEKVQRMLVDEDTEMDDGTPTMTARPVGAPWRAEGGLGY
ncbi:putative glucan 1, 4-alpha-glucosidase [Triangularia verruculosa]|uniref:Glucan 1, 4-alpha-glucosidase n=1 Tax=Triangularia verruculosa TaxID=2587418 RepID=A0AAN6XAL5_9PEZI|nr:putative glucan 1, 4-alpha-glucosidase [Triangularia verruculosa]